MSPTGTPYLPSFAFFGAMLAVAGLPIYIYAPKFYVDEYGVTLGALGAVLFGLRLIDLVQDPLLGRLSERFGHRRCDLIWISAGIMAVAMVLLFAVRPIGSPVLWFAGALTLLFSGYSLGAINFYAQGVATSARLGADAHLRLARWRESGAFIGVCVAAALPAVLGLWMAAPFMGFAGTFAVLIMLASAVMRNEWSQGAVGAERGGTAVLRDPLARRLLLIAMLNATPLAVTSALFLFFVESRLDASGSEGWLLLVFFASAGIAVPFWSRLAEVFGAKAVLQVAMVLAIAGFGFALGLGAGDVAQFAIISAVSGAALGADLTILPALFSKRMAQISPQAAAGFGLWSFASKFTLAFAAVCVLPLLDRAGYVSGAQDNTVSALWTLSLLYAGLPCALKLIALAVVTRTTLEG